MKSRKVIILSIGGSGRAPLPFPELICRWQSGKFLSLQALKNRYPNVVADSSKSQPFQHFGQAFLSMQPRFGASERRFGEKPARHSSAVPYSAPLLLPAWVSHAA